MYTTNYYNYGGGSNATEVSNIPAGVVKEDYTEVILSSGKNYFLGFTESNEKIDRAFVCGIKSDEPNNGTVFCVEGKTDSSAYTRNTGYLNQIFGPYDENTGKGCQDNGSRVNCNSPVGVGADSLGDVNAYVSAGGCYVSKNGGLYCY